MNIEIDSRKENPLLDRTEVRFNVLHGGEATPTRETVKAELANLLGVDKKAVVIDNVTSKYGTTKSSGYAKVYKSVDSAMKYERQYQLKRAGLVKEE